MTRQFKIYPFIFVHEPTYTFSFSCTYLYVYELDAVSKHAVSIGSPGFDADDNPAVYLTPCLYLNGPFGMGFSFKCFEEQKHLAGYLCDWYNYEKRGAVCGQEGKYQMDFSVEISTDIDDIINFDDWGLPIDIMVKASPSETCADDLGDSPVTYSVVGVLVLSAAAAGVMHSRRRRMATSSDQDRSVDFVEMADETVV